jgi:hypothetical protein
VRIATSVASALLALIALASCNPRTAADSAIDARSPGERALPGHLAFSGLSVVGGEIDRHRFSMVADRATYEHRRSASGLFTYQNLTELHLSDVVAELHPQRLGDEAGTHVDLLAALSTWIGRVGETGDLSEGQSETKARRLSRAVFNRLMIRIYTAEDRIVTIQADHARGNADLESLLFHGRVLVVDADGQTLRGPQAIWHREPPGLYVPPGHELAEEVRDREAFFSIDQAGAIVERSPVPTVSYEDPLLELEDTLLGPLENGVLGLVLGFGSSLDVQALLAEDQGAPAR